MNETVRYKSKIPRSDFQQYMDALFECPDMEVIIFALIAQIKSIEEAHEQWAHSEVAQDMRDRAMTCLGRFLSALPKSKQQFMIQVLSDALKVNIHLSTEGDQKDESDECTDPKCTIHGEYH